MKKILSGSIAVAALLALSACSTPVASAPADTAQATANATASATTSAKPSKTASAAVPEAKDGIVEITSPLLGETLPFSSTPVNDGKGDYLPVTILDNDPLLKLNASAVEQTAKDLFTPEEIESVNKTAVKFMATEAIDSILNNNPSDVAATKKWLAEHDALFSPSDKSDLVSTTLSNSPDKPIVFRGQFRQGKYELDYGKAATHVASRDVKVTRILAAQLPSGQTAIGVAADVNFSLNAKVDGKIVIESTSGTASYTYVKNPAGGWHMTGYYSYYNTTPVKG